MRMITLVVGLLLSGCGVNQAELTEAGDDTSLEFGELGTASRSYVVMRHDQRRCVSPMCGGFWVHDVNRTTVREEYVSGLDFTGSDIVMEEHQNDVTGARDFEVVVFGKLGRKESRFGTRTFVVTSAWRGMPGMQFKEGVDAFYRVEGTQIRCITTPCPTLQASKLHSGSKVVFHDLNVSPAAKPLVDQDWLAHRVIERDALVAGRFVTGKEKVLNAAQVFIKVPDRTQSCPRPSPAQCPEPDTNLWVRNENLCLMPAGCGGGGACAAFVPTCEDGYQLISWTGGPFACTQYACDPAFLND